MSRMAWESQGLFIAFFISAINNSSTTGVSFMNLSKCRICNALAKYAWIFLHRLKCFPSRKEFSEPSTNISEIPEPSIHFPNALKSANGRWNPPRLIKTWSNFRLSDIGICLAILAIAKSYVQIISVLLHSPAIRDVRMSVSRTTEYDVGEELIWWMYWMFFISLSSIAVQQANHIHIADFWIRDKLFAQKNLSSWHFSLKRCNFLLLHQFRRVLTMTSLRLVFGNRVALRDLPLWICASYAEPCNRQH